MVCTLCLICWHSLTTTTTTNAVLVLCQLRVFKHISWCDAHRKFQFQCTITGFHRTNDDFRFKEPSCTFLFTCQVVYKFHSGLHNFVISIIKKNCKIWTDELFSVTSNLKLLFVPGKPKQCRFLYCLHFDTALITAWLFTCGFQHSFMPSAQLELKKKFT